MPEIDTTPPPAGKVRLDCYDRWDREREFTLQQTELIEAKAALSHLLRIASKCIYAFHHNPAPTRVAIGGGGFNKCYRDEMIGSAPDLQSVYDFAKIYDQIRRESEAAVKISVTFEQRVRAELETETRERAKHINCDSASARRGSRRASKGPATPLTWRQRTLLGHGDLKCTLLECLGALNEEGFSRLGGLKNETLIDLLDYKRNFPKTPVTELAELAA